MTDKAALEKLAELRELSKKATAGEWRAVRDFVSVSNLDVAYCGSSNGPNNAALIAAAVNFVRAALRHTQESDNG